MKRGMLLFFTVCVFSYAHAATVDESSTKPPVDLQPGTTITEIYPEKIEFVEKAVKLSGLVSNDGKLRGSIGIETLAGIITPLIESGQKAPVSVSIKLGISSNCDCAKLKLFRIFNEKTRKPEEISYDAIRGFSADNKTVEVVLEVTPDSQLYQRVKAPKTLVTGKSLEWMPAKDIKPKAEVVKTEKIIAAPEEKVATDDSAEQTPALPEKTDIKMVEEVKQ